MWNILDKIIIIISALWILYLYIDNRRFKGFDIDKKIKLLEVEIEKCNAERLNESDHPRISLEPFDYNKRNIEYKSKIEKLVIELKYLQRLKKYRWIFSKIKL